jgi:hypothetical protein
VLVFIEFDTRRVYITGIPANHVGGGSPNRPAISASSGPSGPTRPNSSSDKFSASVDEAFHSESVRIIETPIRSPRANAFSERFVGTVRRECLDRILVFHHRQLE